MPSATLDELDRKIREATRILEAKDALETAHAETKDRIASEKVRIEEIEKKLEDCRAAARESERKAQTSLFSSEKHRSLLQQRQGELFVLTREHEDAEKRLADLEARKKRSSRELETIRESEGALDEALSAKHDAIRRMDDGAARTLDGFADDIEDREESIEDLDETIEIGEAALGLLGEVFEKLHSALKYGAADIFLGGVVGGLVTSAKHRRLDEAGLFLEDAQRAVALFQRKVRDVAVDMDIQTRLSDFALFADYHGGFIADIAIQSKIGTAHSRTKEAREQIATILDSLEDERDELLNEIERLKDERDAYIEDWKATDDER
jgi:chromosome segregation ATPase